MFTQVNGIDIKAISCCVPKEMYSIREYAPELLKSEKTAKRMVKSTGISHLRISPKSVTTADLFQKAAEPVLADIDKKEIAALVFVTQTPDYLVPTTGHILQNKLGLRNDILCLDITEGCSGYVTGLYTSCMLANQLQGPVIFGGGDTISHITNPNDRATRVIFGDAATATLVTPGSHNAFFSFESYGERWRAIVRENSGFRRTSNPINDGCLYLDGMGIMEFSLNEVPTSIHKMLTRCNFTLDDVDLFACHQANKLILTSLAQKLGVPAEKLPWVSEDVGNESSASIPMVLSAMRGKKLNRVFCSGFGVGLSIGNCITDFSDTKLYGVSEL